MTRAHSVEILPPLSLQAAHPVKSAELLSPTMARVNDAALSAMPIDSDALNGSSVTDKFPFLAWEMIQLGLASEEYNMGRLDGYAEGAREIQDKINKILDFSEAISGFNPDDNEFDLSEDARQILRDLKEQGVDLLKVAGEDRLSKQKLLELKSAISSRLDELKMEHNSALSTKIQPLIHLMSQINDCMRMIEKYNSRLGQALTRNPHG